MTLFDATDPGVLIQATPERTIALVGGRLVDGTGAAPLQDSTVVITGGRIAALGRRDRVVVPAGAERIDASGHTVVPGLVDAHVHLTGEATTDPYRRHLVPHYDTRLLRASRDAATMLAQGATTVRDLGSAHGANVRRAVRRELVRGPRVVSSLQPITSTGGSGEEPALPGAWTRGGDFEFSIADGVDGCRFQVRRVFREGADLVSVMLSGGVLGEGVGDRAEEVELSLEELQAIVDETHRRGSRVAVHAVGDRALRFAVEAGVDTIEGGAGAADDELLALMVKRGIVLVPTLSAFRRAGAPELLERASLLVRRARGAGVTIAAGSDSTGAVPAPLAEELSALVEAGLSAPEALQAATYGGAVALGLAAQVGTLEAGKRADVLVLSVDPLSDPGAVGRPGTIAHMVQQFAKAPPQDPGRPDSSNP